MKNLKTPKEDSLRGTGVNKMGWSEGGRMHSTVKRLMKSFSTENTPTKRENKKKVTCPICKKEFLTNNPNKVPDHKRRYTSYMCEGSFSKQKSGEIITHEISFVPTSLGILNVGDGLLIDFTRTIWKEYGDFDDLIKSKVLKIEQIDYLRNDGTIYGSSIKLYLEGLDIPVPNNLSLFNHCMKI